MLGHCAISECAISAIPDPVIADVGGWRGSGGRYDGGHDWFHGIGPRRALERDLPAKVERVIERVAQDTTPAEAIPVLQAQLARAQLPWDELYLILLQGLQQSQADTLAELRTMYLHDRIQEERRHAAAVEERIRHDRTIALLLLH